MTMTMLTVVCFDSLVYFFCHLCYTIACCMRSCCCVFFRHSKSTVENGNNDNAANKYKTMGKSSLWTRIILPGIKRNDPQMLGVVDYVVSKMTNNSKKTFNVREIRQVENEYVNLHPQEQETKINQCKINLQTRLSPQEAKYLFIPESWMTPESEMNDDNVHHG